VKTHLFLDRGGFTTPRCSRNTVNPTFDAMFSLTQIVTDDFIEYLSNSALEVQVWGKRPPPPTPKTKGAR